jgi:hypothetical protein
MDPTDEMIQVLAETVQELKMGIMDYNSQMQRVSVEQAKHLQELIKQMHQIALKINTGVIGLQELKIFTNQQLGMQG